MTGLQDATAEFRQLLGEEYVITDRETLTIYETATFDTEQRVPLVVMPGSTEQVQDIVRIANRYRLRMYPVSRGRNWGLGSRVPVQTGNCVLDLQRMNRIVELNEEMGYVTVEPGVTFQQVSDLLLERSSDLFLSVIGGPADSSLVANALERGDGVGPLGDRARYCCALQVVLPTGEVIDTGLKVFERSLTGDISPFGLGPGVESLFFQSNLGIVTRMTVWLARRPPHFQCAIFSVSNQEELNDAVHAVRKLQQLGVVVSTAFSIWNIYRFLTSQITYPWDENGKARSDPRKLLSYLPARWTNAAWIGFVGLYAASPSQARSAKSLVRKALKRRVQKLIMIDSLTARIARTFRRPIRKITGTDVGKILDLIYFHSPYLGYPPQMEGTNIYWRKHGPRPRDADPDRDRCGLHWICVSLPYDGCHVARLTALMEKAAFEHGLEPQVMFYNMSEWLLKAFAVIVYDRDEEGEEKRARKCYEATIGKLVGEGYAPVRLGIQSMGAIAPAQQSYVDTIQKLKKLFDPNDILAPGRYDFRQCWK
jgi:4-cresol dehydrogenase (hydroxylating)